MEPGFNEFLELKTLILDLDETLIHAEDYQRGKTYDKIVDMSPPGTRTNDVSILHPDF
jgi:predicted HAD superfamily phosphohydrolase YqeG